MLKSATKPPTTFWVTLKKSWLLWAIILLASFTRLYRLPLTLQFLGDQGRDAIIVSRIWRHYDLPFIGPVTSIGNVYLGPLYYYYMLPWLWLSYPSPLGPAYGVALLSILTVYLTYRWGQELVGRRSALLAAFMMAVNSSAVIFGRFSWNPNPAPLASLAFIYSLFRAQKDYYWWLLTALAAAVLIQLHYITLLCLPIALLIWLVQFWQLKKESKDLIGLLSWTFGAFILFVVMLLPLILFDLKHHGQNLMGFWQLIGPNPTIGHAASHSWLSQVMISIFETHARAIYLLISPWWSLTTGFASVAVVGFMLVLVRLFLLPKPKSMGLKILTVTFIISLLGLSFYGQNIYDHYVLFLLPVTTLLWSVVLIYLARQHVLLKVMAMLMIMASVVYNVSRWPLLNQASPSIEILKTTAQKITEQVQPGEKYNIVLLSDTKDYYGSNYRYFLTTYLDKQPLIPERDDLNSAQTLIVVDETRRTTDLNSIQQAEIRAFPNKIRDNLIEIPDGPRLFILHRQASQVDIDAYNGK